MTSSKIANHRSRAMRVLALTVLLCGSVVAGIEDGPRHRIAWEEAPTPPTWRQAGRHKGHKDSFRTSCA